MKEFFSEKSVAITITLVGSRWQWYRRSLRAEKARRRKAAPLSADTSGWAKKNYAQYEDSSTTTRIF